MKVNLIREDFGLIIDDLIFLIENFEMYNRSWGPSVPRDALIIKGKSKLGNNLKILNEFIVNDLTPNLIHDGFAISSQDPHNNKLYNFMIEECHNIFKIKLETDNYWVEEILFDKLNLSNILEKNKSFVINV